MTEISEDEMQAQGAIERKQQIDRIDTIYPGHPCLLAMQIMMNFGTIESVNRKTTHGWPEPLGCGNIRGAGGAVYTAIEIVNMIWSDPDHPEHAFEQGVILWNENRKSDFAHKREEGNAAASAARSEFLWIARNWIMNQQDDEDEESPNEISG